MHQFTVYIGQAIVAALMTECESGMVEAQEVQNGGVEVMHMDGLLGD